MLLKPFAEYCDEYAVRVAELQADCPLGPPIVGEAAQEAFIALFGSILRLRNFLRSFEEFTGSELLAPRTVQDYRSVYLNLYQDFRSQRGPSLPATLMGPGGSPRA